MDSMDRMCMRSLGEFNGDAVFGNAIGSGSKCQSRAIQSVQTRWTWA